MSLQPCQDPIGLVSRIQRGDARAEEELVGSFYGGVFTVVTGRIHDREAAQEIANDVLMAVLAAVRAGRIHEAERLSGFVMGTARNLANNYLRTRLSRPHEEPLDPELMAADPWERLEQRERLEAVRRWLDLLGHMERQIMLMTIIDGYKPGRIARYLGLSPEVVRARKCRAIRKFTVEPVSGDYSVRPRRHSC